jgi:hypothetical protein
LELTADQSIVDDNSRVFTDEVSGDDSVVAVHDASEMAFELGLWLSGLESFLRAGERGYAVVQQHDKNAARDHVREMRLTHSALLLCSRLNFRLRRSLTAGAGKPVDGKFPSLDQTVELGLMMRNAILLNEALIKSGSQGFGEWCAWRETLSEKLAASDEVKTLIAYAERSGETYLPDGLVRLLEEKKLPFADEAELQIILPKFARILKWLSIVGRMLRDDEPLKLTLLVFARVHEQTTELISYIDNRLARFPDETAELFGSLDGASYTASLELKKVYTQELIGLVGVRPAPSVYARIETAYALLNDSFQQILSGFARLADPDASMLDMFPSFRSKLDHSLQLREHLALVRNSVRIAEQAPGRTELDDLRKELTDLLDNTMQYLFYKDRETIERFSEEIFAAGEKNDLVPILHRFGAYLETLFGQVNMRTVLHDHPFVDTRL